MACDREGDDALGASLDGVPFVGDYHENVVPSISFVALESLTRLNQTTHEGRAGRCPDVSCLPRHPSLGGCKDDG